MSELKSFFRYLPLSKRDAARGLHVSAGGYTLIPPGTPYPPSRHPRDHHFEWGLGRVLRAHQIVYVSRGRGRFESEPTGELPIRAGDVFLLFPGVWHRYVPDPATGWDEHWLECGGSFVKKLYGESALASRRPIVHPGVDRTFLELFYELAAEIEAERVGHQHVLAAIATRIIASLAVIPKRRAFRDTRIEATIERAKAIFVKHAGAPLNMEEVAAQLSTGYTWFRRTFKEYTGMSPGQYHLQLRLARARQLLEGTSLTVSEVAAACGFATDRYFVRLFRSRTGKTPGAFRDAHRRSAGGRDGRRGRERRTLANTYEHRRIGRRLCEGIAPSAIDVLNETAR